MEFDDLDTSRSWVVLISCFLSLLVNGGTNYSVGLIHRALLERYGRSNAVTSWAGSLHSALFSLASPMSSVLVDKGSCRVAIVTSGVLFTVGYFSTAFAPTLEVAIFTCSISGLGGAAGYAASIVALGFYFRRFRNFAQGFALSGIGVGLFVLSPVMQASREAYGMTGFFLVLASISMQIIVCGVLVKPSKLERCTQFRRKSRSTQETEAKAVCTCTLFKTYFEVLTTKPITFLSLGFLLDYGATYEQIFVIGGLTLLLAALCSLVSTVFARQISKQALEPNMRNTEVEVKVHENKADEKAGDNEENLISKDPG